MVSDLGWTAVRTSGARRVGPHIAHPDNPRELGFRNAKIGDLLIAVAWLIHTGNGGQLPDYPIRQLHTARPVGAAFGSTNSDHHAQVAMDANWDGPPEPHYWEQGRNITPARYNQHINAGGDIGRQHQLFAAVEARVGLVKWCGRPWTTDDSTKYNGPWTAYRSPNRDCMHWVIGSRHQWKIDQAHAALIRWFVPPRTVADIRALQKRLGIDEDGQWGPGSVAAMRVEQRRLKVPATGLPGDVATRAAWARPTTPAPTPAPQPSAQTGTAQRLLIDLGYSVGPAGADGHHGNATTAGVGAYAADEGFTGPTDRTTTALINHLEDSMSKLDKIITTQAAHGRELTAIRAEQKETPDRTVTAWLSRVLYGFNLAWWLRRGFLGNRIEHENYPADPGSPADLELRVASAVLDKDVRPYDGTQKRGES